MFNISFRLVLAAAGSVALALALSMLISFLLDHPGVGAFLAVLLVLVVVAVIWRLIAPTLRL